MICTFCGHEGHFAKDCPVRYRHGNKLLTAAMSQWRRSGIERGMVRASGLLVTVSGVGGRGSCRTTILLRRRAVPWTPSDANSKTHKASTPRLQRQWAHVANEELARTGDDATAIKAANGVVARGSIKPRAGRREYGK